MKLSTHLDEITKHFWDAWTKWRKDAGWRLGPDNPNAMLNPFLVDSFDKLTPEGKGWFRAHAALVLHAVEQTVGVELEPLSTMPAKSAPPKPGIHKAEKTPTVKAETAGVAGVVAQKIPVLQGVLMDALRTLNSRDVEGGKIVLARALRMAKESVTPNPDVLKALRVASKSIENYRQGEDPKRTKKSVKTALSHVGASLDDVFAVLADSAPAKPVPNEKSRPSPVSVAKAGMRARLPGNASIVKLRRAH